MSWESKFQNSVTNTALHLSLSRRMVIALEMAHAYHQGTSSADIYYKHLDRFNHFVPAVASLKARGLVLHHNVDGPEPPGHKWYTLTPAGELVYQLCVLAGLITPRQKAANSEVA